jgi:hypothetical protein
VPRGYPETINHRKVMKGIIMITLQLHTVQQNKYAPTLALFATLLHLLNLQTHLIEIVKSQIHGYRILAGGAGPQGRPARTCTSRRIAPCGGSRCPRKSTTRVTLFLTFGLPCPHLVAAALAPVSIWGNALRFFFFRQAAKLGGFVEYVSEFFFAE